MTHDKKPPPTVERVRALLHYDPETGVFTWRAKRNFAHRLTESAGGITKRTDGRAQHVIAVDGRRCNSQRLAWLYQTGHWPTVNVIFVDGDPLNMAFRNLRLDTGATAQLRKTQPGVNSSTGVRGVRKCVTKDGRARFEARLKVDGKRVILGVFDTLKRAQAAYLKAKQELRLRGHVPKRRPPRRAPDPRSPSRREPGPRIAPIERARMQAQALLDKIVPYEQWAGRHAPATWYAALGAKSARDCYDTMVHELKKEIQNPTPTSLTFGPDGKVIRAGYAESH